MDNNKIRDYIPLYFSGIFMWLLIFLSRLLENQFGKQYNSDVTTILLGINIYTQWVFILLGIKLLLNKNVLPFFKLIFFFNTLFLILVYTLIILFSIDSGFDLH